MIVKKETLVVKLWNCLWPLFIYQIVQYAITICGSTVLTMNAVRKGILDEQELLKLYNQYAMIFLIAAALICIPIYYKMYQKDEKKTERMYQRLPLKGTDYLLIILCGASLALASNNLISITPLPYLFSGYEEVNDAIYGGSIVLQILGAGILGCIVEELSLRAITYNRMKHYWGRKTAIVFSAAVFGIYHLNVVQAVYAFILGLFFAWVYDRYETIWAPVTAHMSANLFVLLLSGSEVIMNAMSTLIGYCLFTCGSLLIFFYGWRFMKQTKPVIKLQFEEKAPDELSALAKEYQEKQSEEE